MAMSAPFEENSPGEPQLSAVSDRPAEAVLTDPSPPMPALSPYPFAHETCSGDSGNFERKRMAKKMLNFGPCPGARCPTADDRLRPMEEEEHTLAASVVPTQEEISPRNVKDIPSPETNKQNRPSDACPKGTKVQEAKIECPSPALTRNVATKRPHSVSSGESDPKLQRLSPTFSDNAALDGGTTSNGIEAGFERGSDTQVQGVNDQVSLLPLYPTQAEGVGLNVFQDTEKEGDDPENVLRYHGIDLFGNATHRQELISFCEQSLVQSSSNYSEVNNNNNNFNDGHSHLNHEAHAQFNSMIERARARGFTINDAVYFDGKQYVSIKVASNGRGKFRLLLPPDHPHRKGVAEEIPIFKTFEIDDSQMETGDDEEEEQTFSE